MATTSDVSLMLSAVVHDEDDRTGWLVLADAMREAGREAEAGLIARRLAESGEHVLVAVRDGRVLPAYVYTVRTDADMGDVVATDRDDAIRQYTAGGPVRAETWEEYREALGELEMDSPGTWAWIESDEAPDGNRLYIHPENL